MKIAKYLNGIKEGYGWTTFNSIKEDCVGYEMNEQEVLNRIEEWVAEGRVNRLTYGEAIKLELQEFNELYDPETDDSVLIFF